MTLKNNLKNFFTHNIGKKLVALFFAFVAWIAIVNVDDPVYTRVFTTTVKVVNESVLIEEGKYYTISDNANTVSFRVTAKRSIIEKLSGTDFEAIADMNYLQEDSRIPIEITCPGHPNSVTISNRQQYLTVVVDEERTSRFVIEGKTSGDPQEGYAVTSVEVSPNVVTVTGPADIVSVIDKAVAKVDISGLNVKTSHNANIVLYDKNGHEVDTTKLQLNIDSVKVEVNLARIKSVAVRVNTGNNLIASFGTLVVDPDTVDITGSADAIASVNEIVIPSGVVNIPDASVDYETTVDIRAYLPEGISLVNESQANVKVSFTAVGKQAKVIELSTADINVTGLGDGLSLKFSDATVSVMLHGTKEELSVIEAAMITATVNLSDLEAGTHNVKINLELPGNVKADPVTATVIIREA